MQLENLTISQNNPLVYGQGKNQNQVGNQANPIGQLIIVHVIKNIVQEIYGPGLR